MKVYAICVIKNEADIIEYTLKKALTWADKIIVYDNGSTDETLERVKEIKNSKIIVFKQDAKPYSDGLRAEVFHEFKGELEEGDWWVILDGDEEYDQDPQEFIKSQRGYFQHINGKKIDFCFNLNHLDSLSLTGDFTLDKHYFDHYTPIAWSEPRLILHRRKLRWTVEEIWPRNMGLVCDSTIHIRHYPLRSLSQIKKRWETRNHLSLVGGQYFNHWEKKDWQSYYMNKLENLQKVPVEDNVFNLVSFANDYHQSFIKKLILRIGLKSGLY